MAEEPCNWTINTDCCPDWDSYSPELQANATAWATQILWALSGRRFGLCTVQVRPCGSTCQWHGGYMTWPVQSDGTWSGGGSWWPYVDSTGTWRNCACTGACSCQARCQVWLPGPVATIAEVRVDGIIIDPGSYRVDNGSILVRTDGECWPECQDLNLSGPDQESTFFVTYERGEPVPLGGELAAGILACSFAKDCQTGCGLPGNLSSLSRQGVEISFVDVTSQIGAGLTGVPQVDTWLRAVNPGRRTQRAKVYSPDVKQPRTTTS